MSRLSTSKSVLEYVEGFIEEKGYSPTVQEISEALGYAQSTVHDHLVMLRDMALISWTPGKSRTIVLPDDPGERVWEE